MLSTTLRILLVTPPDRNDLSIPQVARVRLLRSLHLKANLVQWLQITFEVLDRRFLQRSLVLVNRISLRSRIFANLFLYLYLNLKTTTGNLDFLLLNVDLIQICCCVTELRDSVIVCKCRDAPDALLLTVRKEGPNTGRQFYKCAKPQDGCDFFLWADTGTNVAAPAPNSRGGGGGAVFRQPSTRTERRDSGHSETHCDCDGGGRELATTRTTQKPGPNCGRQFYCCAKPRESQCNFFKWMDDNGASGSGSAQGSREGFGRGGSDRDAGSRGRGRGRGNSSDPSSSNARRARKCGNCGEEGDTAKNNIFYLTFPKFNFSISYCRSH